MDVPALVRAQNGFPDFNPMQQKVLQKKWGEKNLLVCAPTASGKTVVAELCAMDTILNKKQKVVYTCPLRALAAEHHRTFSEKYKDTGARFALSTGDMDSASKHLGRFDLVFCTYEKLDSLIRHGAPWLSEVGLLVVDEVHELDSGRGATLEVVLTKFRLLNPKSRTLSLSATVRNARELAKWLDAVLVQSDFRPVPLREGVFFDRVFTFARGCEKCEAKSADPVHAIVEDTLHAQNKQCLVFASTRKNAAAAAKRLQKTVEKKLLEKEKDSLRKAAFRVQSALEDATDQCKLLAESVSHGVAFHHAGLVGKQRTLVEDLFRDNVLKVIVATPTLAAGVNLPAHTVVVSSVYRFGSAGSERLAVREVKQMVGRAGRPKYDSEGRGIIVARSEQDADFLLEHFVRGETEDITSSLGAEPVLRTHLLSAIASHFIFDLASMEQFFSKTLYFHQFGQPQSLLAKLSELVTELSQMGFVKTSPQKIEATTLGRRVSELYLDPFAATQIISALNHPREPLDFAYLFLLADCGELYPLLSVPRKDQALLWEELEERANELLFSLDERMLEDPDLLRKYHTARLLDAWVSEVPHQLLADRFNTPPGLLRTKLERADWLVYATFELARLQHHQRHLIPLEKLRARLKYGVKEELLRFVALKGIGRVRARRLHKAGIKRLADLKAADTSRIAAIINSLPVAKDIKKQLGQKDAAQEGATQKML